MNTNNIVMWETVQMGLFQDSDFAGDLENAKSTSGGTFMLFPISWMCKNQTSVSHSSTESVIISLDAGLRMAGILDLWDLIVSVLHGITHQNDQVRKDPYKSPTRRKFLERLMIRIVLILFRQT